LQGDQRTTRQPLVSLPLDHGAKVCFPCDTPRASRRCYSNEWWRVRMLTLRALTATYKLSRQALVSCRHGRHD
jgi:hypothetical protein